MTMRRWLCILLACVLLYMLVSCTTKKAVPHEEPTDVRPTETIEEQPTVKDEEPDEADLLAVYARYSEGYPFDRFPLYEMMNIENFGYTITDMGNLGYGELYTFTYFVNKQAEDVLNYYKDLAGAEVVGQRYSIDGYSLQVFANDYSGKTLVTVILSPPTSPVGIVHTDMVNEYQAQKPLMCDLVTESKILSNGVQLTREGYFLHRGFDANDEGLGEKLKVFYQETLQNSTAYATSGDDTNWTIVGEYNGFKMEAGFSYGIFTLSTWYTY